MDDFIDDFAKHYGINALGGMDNPDVQLAYKIGVLREMREGGQKIHHSGPGKLQELRQRATTQAFGCGPAYKGPATMVLATDDQWALACLIDSLDVNPPRVERWS